MPQTTWMKMGKKRLALIIVFLLLYCLAVSLAVAGPSAPYKVDRLVEVRAVLSGTVASEGLVQVGQLVVEGDVLVNVQSFAGLSPTARATVEGQVMQVLVSPGQQVQTDTVVVKIKAKN